MMHIKIFYFVFKNFKNIITYLDLYIIITYKLLYLLLLLFFNKCNDI